MSADGINIPIDIEWGDGIDGLHEFVKVITDSGRAVTDFSGNAEKASAAWGKFSASAKSVTDTLESIGRAYRNIVGPFEDVASKIVDLTEGVIGFAREGQRLDAATRITGVNFQTAARSGTAFVDSLTASTAAMRLHQAGLRLTQDQMNALIAVSTDFATKTGADVTQSVEQLTDALLGGEQEGLRRFGTALGAMGGEAHTADERLAALTETAANLSGRVEDIGLRFDRAKGSMQEFAREASTGFATGVTQAIARGDQAAARFIERETQGIATTREWFTAIGQGAEAARQSLSLIADVANVGLSAIAALDGDVASLTRSLDGLSETWSRLRASFRDGAPAAPQAPTGPTPTFEAPAPGQDLQSFVGRLTTSLRGAANEAQRAISNPLAYLNERLGADLERAVAKTKRGSGGGGGDPLASLRTAISLTRELAQQEQADLERSNTLRRRDVELMQLGAATEHERLRLVEVERAERERASRATADLAREELQRLGDLEEVINRRMTGASARIRSGLTAQLQQVETEQRALQTRIEEAEAVGRRVAAERTAERDRIAREAIDAGIERERRIEQLDRHHGGNDVRTMGDRIDAQQQARALARTQRNLDDRLAAEVSFTDRMEDLHHTRVNASQMEAEAVTSAFSSLGQAMGKHIQLVVTGKETIGTALQGILADTLTSIGQEAIVKGAMQMAEGLAMLAGVYTAPLAPGHFAAGAAFIGVGALASAAGAALAPAPPTPAGGSAGGGASAGRAASVSRGSGDGEGATVVNVMFGGPQYGTGGVRQAAREIAGVMNRGAIQGGVRLNLRGSGGAI